MKSDVSLISTGPSMPEVHDLAGWRQYSGPYCRWMADTGIAAPGSCKSQYIECTCPGCPISKPYPNGKKMTWKTRYCHPQICRFFEF